jgi:hypothetical protein
VRGDHRFRSRFDRRRIAGIPTESVKIHQVAAGAVHEETDQLFENLKHRKPLPASSQRTEQPLHVGLDPYAAQIANEQRQATTASERIARYRNVVNLGVDL